MKTNLLRLFLSLLSLAEPDLMVAKHSHSQLEKLCLIKAQMSNVVLLLQFCKL